MTAQNTLEIKGSLQSNPFAELLVEAQAANLTGSFRLAHENQKIVVYLTEGKPVFAVSNARQHRLFEMLLQNNQISKNHLIEIPNFTNDLEFAAALKAKNVLSKEAVDKAFSSQVEGILKTAFSWTEGEWVFSPLMRVKENIQFKVELPKLFLEYARNLPSTFIVRRFNTLNQSFGANPSADMTSLQLLPAEAFVLSRFEKSFLKVEEVKILSGLSEGATLQTLYILWLAGFLFRQNWSQAFSDKKIFEISSAKLSLKKPEDATKQEASAPVAENPPVKLVSPEIVQQSVNAEAVAGTSVAGLNLEEYLLRSEDAASYYEFFELADDAGLTEIKRAYFAIAKQFHPDKYHQEQNSELLHRIQSAFSLATQGYETLKDEDKRRAYNYKLSKQATTLKKRTMTPSQAQEDIKQQQAAFAKEAFDEGFNLLMEDEFEEAIPFLARATQLAPNNARYHAFYGKALSSDETQRYKADSEMQTAIRLDPQNATFRIIMVEFYIQFGLYKRAEGELQRLLAIHPNHHEATALLNSLPKR